MGLNAFDGDGFDCYYFSCFYFLTVTIFERNVYACEINLLATSVRFDFFPLIHNI